MVKIEGTQTIPADLLDLYRNNLCSVEEFNIVRKRYPFRIRLFQKFGYKVTDKQERQRERFLTAIDKFDAVDMASRSRWYASQPIWGSFLWYYNYFILSALDGVLGANLQGAVVIKSIQNIFFTMAFTGNLLTLDTGVNTDKALCFPYGAGYSTTAHSYSDQLAVAAWPVFFYASFLNSLSISVGPCTPLNQTFNAAVQVVEYI